MADIPGTIRGRVGYPWAVAAELELVAPRGYCAGVDRAIETVERMLDELGPPVYVRGEIVHNKHVVESLAAKGAVFVTARARCPHGRDDHPLRPRRLARGAPRLRRARACA